MHLALVVMLREFQQIAVGITRVQETNPDYRLLINVAALVRNGFYTHLFPCPPGRDMPLRAIDGLPPNIIMGSLRWRLEEAISRSGEESNQWAFTEEEMKLRVVEMQLPAQINPDHLRHSRLCGLCWTVRDFS